LEALSQLVDIANLVEEYHSVLSLYVDAEDVGDWTLVDNPEFLFKLVGKFVGAVSGWRDVTAGDSLIGPKWIPKPELKNYKVVMGGYIRKAVTLGLQGYRVACLHGSRWPGYHRHRSQLCSFPLR
jgi:hypothetical protein